MELWQYNAWCEAYKDRQTDNLVIQIQAEYLGAYWNGFSKHKKSLNSVINSIQRRNKKVVRKPIDVQKVSDDFRMMEELKQNGWTQKRS
jgi:hypothetical protein